MVSDRATLCGRPPIPDSIRLRIAAQLAAILLLALAPAARATAPPVRGPLPEPVARTFAAGGFPVRPPLVPSSIQASAHAVWRVPVILVSYADSALTHGPSSFNQTLFDTSGAVASIYDYYRWVSRAQVRVLPIIVGVVTAPSTRATYGGNFWGLASGNTGNDYALVHDALTRLSPSIDWSTFDQDHDYQVDILWVVHAGIGGESDTMRADANNLWSINSQLSSNRWTGGAGAWDTPQLIPGSSTFHYQVDRFSILPELSGRQSGALSEMGVYCHEFGHALGLPDLYDTRTSGYPNAGPGNWSLMATGVYGGDGRSPDHPARPGAWCEQYLGWIRPLRPSRDTTVILDPIEQGGPIVDLQFQGQQAADHFLIENRRRLGYETTLPGEGLIVWHADEATITSLLPANLVNAGLTPGLAVVEADGAHDLATGVNRGDDADPFPGSSSRQYLSDLGPEPSTRTFPGSVTNLGVFSIRAVNAGSSIAADLQVRAPGWQAEVDRTATPYDPVASFGTGTRAVVDASGNLHLVGCENRSGHSQVVLRERIADVWMNALELSQTSGQARDAAITALPGGDLAVVWSDTRSGTSQIFYRVRIRGTWAPEAQLTSLAGDNYRPAIGADARGRVQVAWLNVTGGVPSIRLVAFAYPSPFGQVWTATSSIDRPDVPAIAVSAGGSSVVLWTDVTAPAKIRFAHFHPDSGMGVAQLLADPTGNQPQSVQALFDSSGFLHCLWAVAGPGLSEVRYQRRPDGPVRDTAIANLGGVIQNVRMALDPTGGVHVIFQGSLAAVSQLFYKRWLSDRGWDTWATEITPASDGSATDPVLTAAAPGRVTALYTRYVSGLPRLMERRRVTDLSQLDVPIVPVRPATGPSARAWPNPLRCGQEVRIALEGPDPGGTIEVLDVAGRRVAATLVAAGAREARIPGAITARWTPGLYFLRRPSRPGATLRMLVLR